jgi:predicted dehydrogenase
VPLPVGIGLIGLGRWGRNYVKTLLALPECRLIAVADTDPAALDAVTELPGVAKLDSATRLFADPSIAAVVIAAPDRDHYALSAAAMAAGRDVLVEKPMTQTGAEAESLVLRAELDGRILAVGHTAVYSTDLDSVRVRLDALPSGAIRRVSAVRTSSGPRSADSPWASAAPRGQCADRHSAILFDLCPHDIALAVLLFGAPAAARARAGKDAVEYEISFHGDELLEGRAEWRQPPHVRRFQVGSAADAAGDSAPVPGCRDIRFTPLGRQCLDFIQSCRTRREPLSNGRLGLTVVRCLSALDASCADSGAWVQLSKEC